MKPIEVRKRETRVKVNIAVGFFGAGVTLGVISFFSTFPLGWGFACAVLSAILFMVSLSEADDRVADLKLRLTRQKNVALRASDHDIIHTAE
ncbi:hypothetical protein A3E04_03210 [Candidatus Kuenenbacteria bacterium RIFCSPHIGHO2_12_FULL_42_14]|uniref:Uncharacterized protein n=1 Tax=Candidatus Kuenenbacteria bacterium RIFCSPHIGHO2_12_FULL_42_14 TaxID=1798563 RepID=A0A1F6GKP5_9BACT|nr:MAG: hypothetical protein A3E04_03210 [Candidatus Kuenenbacteria bacterium RIFCSPHIGHO2_12_FULL_42_14]